jgi:hypothetical protein
METVTSSPSTIGWPHAPRRRWLLWVGRILLGLLALIVILAASGVSYEAIMTAATRSAIHFRDSCWMSVVTACTCIASDRAARPSCSRPPPPASVPRRRYGQPPCPSLPRWRTDHH